MILADRHIYRAFEIERWTAHCGIGLIRACSLRIGMNSVDVSLGDTILTPPKGETLDLASEAKYLEVQADEYKLSPGDFILAATRERFDCSAMYRGRYWVQHYDGRSTAARFGLASHVCAGFGDYGFNGAFTLELVNHSSNDLILRPGMYLGQVYFESLSCKPARTYLGRRYSGHNGPIGPKGL